MKFVRTIIVFDQGGLSESEQWRRIHESYTKAICRIVNPPGSDRFLIRRRMRKPDVHGRPTNQWFRNGVVPIKQRFLANLDQFGAQRRQTEGPEQGIAALARAAGNLVLKEYPSRRDVHLDDPDWGQMLRQQAGDFDRYLGLDSGMRCLIKWEIGDLSSIHFSLDRLCFLMRKGFAEIGVIILPTRQFSLHLTGCVASWEEVQCYAAVWQRMGRAIACGMLAITITEYDDLTDDPNLHFIR